MKYGKILDELNDNPLVKGKLELAGFIRYFKPWVSKPRLTMWYYAARGHVCKLHMYCYGSTVI
jgi:hypothetical protein